MKTILKLIIKTIIALFLVFVLCLQGAFVWAIWKHDEIKDVIPNKHGECESYYRKNIIKLLETEPGHTALKLNELLIKRTQFRLSNYDDTRVHEGDILFGYIRQAYLAKELCDNALYEKTLKKIKEQEKKMQKKRFTPEDGIIRAGKMLLEKRKFKEKCN